MNRLRNLIPHLTSPITKPQTRSVAMDATLSPLAGLYKPLPLKGLYYGPNTVQQNLLSCLPTKDSKAFIITGASLANKTPLIKEVEEILGSKHAGTFSNIKEHAPIADLDKATEQVHADSTIDTIIAIGGGSPIDSAKAISYRLNEKQGKFLTHIVIPTTLSAAECTCIAGYTKGRRREDRHRPSKCICQLGALRSQIRFTHPSIPVREYGNQSARSRGRDAVPSHCHGHALSVHDRSCDSRIVLVPTSIPERPYG